MAYDRGEFLERREVAEESSDDELMHYGVKGMKWGKRLASAKAERTERNETRNKTIDEARTRVKSGVAKGDLKSAQKQHRTDVKKMGRELADQKLSDANRKYDTDLKTARMTKSGAEQRRNVAVAVAAVGVHVAVKKGAQWAAQNPEKIAQFTQRAQNVMNGTKAIGPGYEVFKLTLKNGVYG